MSMLTHFMSPPAVERARFILAMTMTILAVSFIVLIVCTI
jgi:hypothetical protein